VSIVCNIFREKILRCGSTICWHAHAAPEISKKSGNSPLVIKDKWRPQITTTPGPQLSVICLTDSPVIAVRIQIRRLVRRQTAALSLVPFTTGHAAAPTAARFRAVASRMRFRKRSDFGVASTNSSESMYSIARSRLIRSGASN
jgi:hypothetical protein